MEIEEAILSDTEFRLFRELVYKLTGIALSDAKRELVQSRFRKRLRYHKLPSFKAYYELVVSQGENSPEITELVNCITTNKTDFYREPHHFEFVANRLVPEKLAQYAKGLCAPRLRIWHAGCSTGEEPYTLGITLLEALKGQPGWDFRQLASDIDTNVLAHAERGVYEQERVEPIPQHLLHTYFLRGRGTQSAYVKVRPELRERITFRQINLLAEQWPINSSAHFDMIFCRNVVIYFDKPTRQRLFARFQTLLKPGGYLFIGHSESLLGISEAFDSLGHTIYRLPEAIRPERVAA